MMQSETQLDGPWQRSKLDNMATTGWLAGGRGIDRHRGGEVVKFATTRFGLPPTPPSTATSSSSSESLIVGGKYGAETMNPTSERQYMIPRRAGDEADPITRVEPALKRSFQLRYGRRYTRDVAYPLPCDVPELQRQNLRTSLACKVFGRPICSADPSRDPPARVLELGCGTGYWSNLCHQMYAADGYDAISFTGMDIVPVAPNLQEQGVNWKFVQHDMRQTPWPFDDGSFDLIMWKDLSLVVNVGAQSQCILDECMRVLRVGGVLEIWEHDNLVRCMQSHTAAQCNNRTNEQVASATATYPVDARTTFAPTQNQYLKAANKWINAVCRKRGLASAPCARMATLLLQEPEVFGDLGVRRVAIPLSSLNAQDKQQQLIKRATSRRRTGDTRLTPEQLSLRQTALLSIVQLIDNLEPFLKQVSGKNDEEWSFWWTSMMNSLCSSEKRTLSGECLEIGAWWATKKTDQFR